MATTVQASARTLVPTHGPSASRQLLTTPRRPLRLLPSTHTTPARASRHVVHFTRSNGIVDVVVSDHNEVKQLFSEFQTPNTSMERRQLIAYEVIRKLAVHSEKEEMVLYPAIKARMGEATASRLLHDQHELKKIMSDMDSLKASDKEFSQTFIHAMEATLAHIKDEETNCLPMFSRELTSQQLQDLADSWNKATATTRPHPAAPNKPPFNTAANLASKPLDAARDAVRDTFTPNAEKEVTWDLLQPDLSQTSTSRPRDAGSDAAREATTPTDD